jgi:hypothetical protein
MKIYTFTLEKGGVQDFKGEWIFDPLDAKVGDRVIYIDYEPKAAWPHPVDYLLVREKGEWPPTKRREWPPNMDLFKTPTLDYLFSQVARLKVLWNLAEKGQDVSEAEVEACIDNLEEFRKKYNKWKLAVDKKRAKEQYSAWVTSPTTMP